jgi:hypothetical protein
MAFGFAALGAWCALACSSGASDDPALGARMRLANAQFVSGATPEGQESPEVAEIDLLSTTIWPGYPDKALRGALGENATAAAIALSSDIGYWIVPAGVPDVSAPTLPTFRATASFSQTLSAGAYTLEVRAVDAAGHFGPPSRQVLTALPSAPARVVVGALVVTLTWDTESDIDLHVVDPLGNEIYHGAPNSRDPFKPGGSDVSNGALDADSNANCEIDGLRQEDVTWATAPPSGHYLVRVDTASLCGTPSAHWTVQVSLDNAAIGEATGVAFDSDTRGTHDRGAGLLVLEFDVP